MKLKNYYMTKRNVLIQKFIYKYKIIFLILYNSKF